MLKSSLVPNTSCDFCQNNIFWEGNEGKRVDLGGREGHGDGKGEVRPKEGFKRERGRKRKGGMRLEKKRRPSKKEKKDLRGKRRKDSLGEEVENQAYKSTS